MPEKALRESKGQAGTVEGRKRAAEMVAERWVECCPSKIKLYVSLLSQQRGRRSPGLLNEGPFATNETWPVAESAASNGVFVPLSRRQEEAVPSPLPPPVWLGWRLARR